MGKIKFKQAIFLITYAVLLVLVVINFKSILGFIGDFLGILAPLFVGIAIAFVLDGPYKALRKLLGVKCKIKDSIAKGLAIALVYVIAFGAVFLLIRFIVPEIAKNVSAFTSNMDVYSVKIQNTLNGILKQLDMDPIEMKDITKVLADQMDKLEAIATGMIPAIWTVTSSIVSYIVDFIFAIVLSIYVMSGQTRLISQIQRVSKAYMPEKVYKKSSYVMDITAKVFKNYVTGQVLDGCILGAAVGIVMAIAGLDYAMLTGIIITLTALIPILGAWIGGALGVILQLFVSPKSALIFIIILLVVQQLDNNITYPRIVGSRIGLPGIFVLLGVIAGGGLLGIVGMFIGVPLTTVLYVLLKQNVNERNGIKITQSDEQTDKTKTTLVANLLEIDPYAERPIKTVREEIYKTEEEKAAARANQPHGVRKKFKR